MRDMTVGHPRQHLWKHALPLLLGNWMQLSYNAVDSIIAGRFIGKEALAAEGGIAADPGDGAALFIHGDEQGNFGGVLISGQLLAKGIRSLVFKIPAEEDKAPQMAAFNMLQSVIFVAPGQKQLPHPLFQGHLIQHLPDGIRWCCLQRQGDSRGFRCRGCGKRGLRHRNRFGCFPGNLPGSAARQKQQTKKNKFHKITFPERTNTHPGGMGNKM